MAAKVQTISGVKQLSTATMNPQKPTFHIYLLGNQIYSLAITLVLLYGRTRGIPIGTEHAAITLFRF